MTYIRRKDDVIFSTNAKVEDIDIKEYKKVADTIEELCDLFMLEPIRKGLTPTPFKQLWKAKKTKNQIKLETTLYGAMWVKGKGLIYVAKMNSEGCLELI